VNGKGEDSGIIPKDESGSVSLGDIEIQDGHPPCSTLLLDDPGCDSHIIEDAEPFPVVREGVMRPAGINPAVATRSRRRAYLDMGKR